MGILDIIGGIAHAKAQLALDERRRKLDAQQQATQALFKAALEGKREFFADPSFTKPFGLSPDDHATFSKIAEAADYGRKARMAELAEFGGMAPPSGALAGPEQLAGPPPEAPTLQPEQLAGPPPDVTSQVQEYIGANAPAAQAAQTPGERAAATMRSGLLAPQGQPTRTAQTINPAAETQRIFEEAQRGTPSTSQTLSLREGDVSLSRTMGTPGSAPSPDAQLRALTEMRAAQEREATQRFATAFLQSRPELANAVPGLLEGVQQGSPEAVARAMELTKDPRISPPLDSLLTLVTKFPDWEQRKAGAFLLYGGDTERATKFLSMYPGKGAPIDPGQLDVQSRTEALAIARERGQTDITPDILREAQTAVIKRQDEAREKGSELVFDRWSKLIAQRANINVVAQGSMNLTKTLGEDADLLARAQSALQRFKTTGEAIAKMTTNTPWLNRPIQAIAKSGQLGELGKQVELFNTWKIDIAVLDNRAILGQGARPAAAITEKIENALPSAADKPSVFVEKMNRSIDLFNVRDKAWRAKRDAAIKTMRGIPELKPAADALEKGYYDIATTMLEPVTKLGLPELPVFGTGEFAPTR